jgi:hypothetical protein
MTLGEADDLVCEFAFLPHPGPPSSTSAKVPCESASACEIAASLGRKTACSDKCRSPWRICRFGVGAIVRTRRTIAPKRLFTGQQRLNLHNGCVLHVRENVRVYLQRECYRGVPKLFAHDFWRHSCG